MFGLTHNTPVTTSLTALSTVSLASFNQFTQSDQQKSLNHFYYHDFSTENSPDVIELSSLDGTEGFKLNGFADHSWSGISVAGAGDVNADGFSDVVIGAPYAADYSGQSYVVFGKSDGFSTVELSNLDGTEGFKLNGFADYSRSGFSVAGAGDVNADGFSDVVIGAPYASPNADYSGQSYVVFGKSDGFGTVELSSLDGTEGFKLNGALTVDLSGNSVAGAGDVNADGFSDVIIGAYRADPNGNDSGQSYIVFGKSGNFSPIELSNLSGTDGFKLNGVAKDNRSGASVAGAGDVNADGFSDVVIGAPYASPNGDDSGQSYVIFGKSGGFGTVELSSLNGTEGFKLNGVAASASGYSVAGAGDVNADGYADVIIGAGAADPNGSSSGQSYVVFGKSGDFGTVELSSLDGTEGFKLNGVAASGSGYSVAGAGDVNADGYADVIIGAGAADPNGSSSGQSYVVFGKSSHFGTVELSNLDGANGFTLNGVAKDDRAGYSVAGAGDVNADGFSDVVIGAPYASPNGDDSGQSYVVFGESAFIPTPPPTPTPTPTPTPLYPDSLNISGLNGQTGSIFTGVGKQALMGNSVSAAGDVNLDGITDIVMGAKGTVVNGVFDAGAGYVVFGDRNEFPANISVTKLTRKNGFSLVGASYEREFATSVSGVGDVNQDGIADTLIGSPYDFNEVNAQTGKAYVVYGRRNLFSQTVNVTQLSIRDGFSLEGESYSDQLGYVVSDAGDMNHDGLSDFMVSAPYAAVDDQIQAGKAYVIFGDYNGYPSVFNMTALNGTNGFTITGQNAFARLGTSLASVGDINGDGISDIAIGAPEALANGKTQAGQVYVLFGSRSAFVNTTAVSSLNGVNGFCLNGAQAFGNFGMSISSGKINDDRVSDIIIGAPSVDNSLGITSGRAYVFFGKSDGFLPQYNISSLNPTQGFAIDGEQPSDRAGTSVAGIGDFNVDGVNDLLIGAPQATANSQPRAGKGYVVFGQRGGCPETISLSSLDGNNGFVIEGANFGDNLGSSVSGAGDMNQDGAPDVLLGAPGEDNGGTGYTALVYGGISLFSNTHGDAQQRYTRNNVPTELSLADANAVEIPAFG